MPRLQPFNVDAWQPTKDEEYFHLLLPKRVRTRSHEPICSLLLTSHWSGPDHVAMSSLSTPLVRTVTCSCSMGSQKLVVLGGLGLGLMPGIKILFIERKGKWCMVKLIWGACLKMLSLFVKGIKMAESRWKLGWVGSHPNSYSQTI